jgi:hypothetical protein
MLVGDSFTPLVLPVTARGANIENCRSTVEFNAPSIAQKGMKGRWENRGKPTQGFGQDWSVFDAITLLKDDDDAIAIAVQHEGDASAFMLCNRSWKMPLVYGQNHFRMPAFLLPPSDPVSVRVTVRGDEMDDCAYEFVLRHLAGLWQPYLHDEIGQPVHSELIFPDVVLDFTGRGIKTTSDQPEICRFMRVRVVNRSGGGVSLSFRVLQKLEHPTAFPEAGGSVVEEVALLPVQPSPLPDPLDLDPDPSTRSITFSEVAYFWPYTTSAPSLSTGGAVGSDIAIVAYDYISEKRVRFGGRWPHSLAMEPW